MSAFASLPAPEGSMQPGCCVRIEYPETGLAVVVLDPPHRGLTVLDGPLLRDLATAVSELAVREDLRGVVFAGRSPSEFAAGADLEAVAEMTDTSVVKALVVAVHELLQQIADLRPLTVAAIGGVVPGGAYEFALACDYIVLADDPKTRVGLPETQLGLLPGWGGCHRMPRRVGVPRALQSILGGRLESPARAASLGMVDRLTKPEYLVRIAADVALGRERLRRRSRGLYSWIVDRNPLATALLARLARRQVLAKTGGHYPAPLAAIALICSAWRRSRKSAADCEARAVATLIADPVCKNLIRIFFATERAKKLGRDSGAPIERAAVVGAGVMGRAIASLLAERGVSTRLFDVAASALDEAQHDHRARMRELQRKHRLDPWQAISAIDRLACATEIGGLAQQEIIIEAVAERLEVKREVLARVAESAPTATILASNTSSLSIDAIAAGLACPERVAGMHFFNPVRRMPLVEIVRGERTPDRVVAALAALALSLGKTPVVTSDVPGFVVNRLLGPYLDEALRLLQGGADPQAIDRAMVGFGMPMGPLALLDEIGFDIASHAAASLHAAFGDRMAPCDVIAALAGPGRQGRKSGLGFYRHAGRRPRLAADLSRLRVGDFAGGYDAAQIQDRLVLAIVNEATRCMEQSVVAHPGDLDLAMVLGTGFAPFRGGPLRHADALGLKTVVARLEAIRRQPDVERRGAGAARFEPTAMMFDRARVAGSLCAPTNVATNVTRSDKPTP